MHFRLGSFLGTTCLILESRAYVEALARVCILHSSVVNDVTGSFGGWLLLMLLLEYSDLHSYVYMTSKLIEAIFSCTVKKDPLCIYSNGAGAVAELVLLT